MLQLNFSFMAVGSNNQILASSEATHIQTVHYTSKAVWQNANNNCLLLPIPVIEVLSNDQMFEVVVNGSLIVLQ